HPTARSARLSLAISVRSGGIDGGKCGDIGQRQISDHGCPLRVRFNLQSAAELTDSFPHPSDSNSGLAIGGHFTLFFCRYTFASIFNEHAHFGSGAFDTNPGSGAFGIAMNLVRTFLAYAR